MKTILASVLVCVLLQVVWVSFSTGEDQDAGCSTFTNSSDCCRPTQNCSWFVCNDNTTVCVDNNNTSSDACGKDSTVTDQCKDQPTTTPAGGATTVGPTDSCSAITDNKTCCNTTNDCAFFNCMKDAAVDKSVCAENKTTAVTLCGADSTPSDNTCSAATTIPPPTTTPHVEVCSDHNDNKTACCETTTISCLFYNCTNADKTQTSTVCVLNGTADTICTKDGDTPQIVQCGDKPVSTTTQSPTTVAPGPTTSQQPTQAPSTGGDSGRHFDGASFIGGIVLCAGIVAIGYFGLKFYKSRQERNYHTL